MIWQLDYVHYCKGRGDEYLPKTLKKCSILCLRYPNFSCGAPQAGRPLCAGPILIFDAPMHPLCKSTTTETILSNFYGY